MVINLLIRIAKKAKLTFKSVLLSYPKRVQCNICGWEGHRFLSDSWHKYIRCPRCYSDIRHRLFFAALQNLDDLLFKKLIHNKRILHFAPEKIISSKIKKRATYYATADFIRRDCSFKIDISNMPEIKNQSFDIVIAFDVLDHVPDYKKAITEVQRILSPRGFFIFTVPQKDKLSTTYENPKIMTPQDRIKHFGQKDHLRIFGDDIFKNVANKGFVVTAVDATYFSEEISKRHVLFPNSLSKHPLATNYRKVFFCQKT